MKKKGFTVIELMLVISIIALLSSIILISLRSARDKAKIAASLTFSNQIKSVIGLETLGEYKFENNLNDTFSPYGNNGSWIGGGAANYADSGNSNLGKSISLDGFHYVQIPYSSSLYPRTDLAVTVEAWIKPLAFPTVSFFSVILAKNDYFILAYDRNETIDFWIMCDGFTTQAGPSTIKVELGKWHHIAATFIPGSGTNNKVEIYIDGIIRWKSGNFSFGSTPLSPLQSILIGSCSGCGFDNFNGLIDEVRIYYEPMPLE